MSSESGRFIVCRFCRRLLVWTNGGDVTCACGKLPLIRVSSHVPRGEMNELFRFGPKLAGPVARGWEMMATLPEHVLHGVTYGHFEGVPYGHFELRSDLLMLADHPNRPLRPYYVAGNRKAKAEAK